MDTPDMADKVVFVEEIECECQSRKKKEEGQEEIESIIIATLLTFITKGKVKSVPRPGRIPIPQPAG